MASEQRIAELKEMEVKAIDKRKSGEAFEVILKVPGQSGDGVSSPLKAVTPKKEISIEKIKDKLTAAEERRKAQQEALRNTLRAEEEKILKVKQKKVEADVLFSKWAQEQLAKKMCQHQNNQIAHLEAKIKKFHEQNMKPDEMREKVRREIDNMCSNLDVSLQQKLSESEQRRLSKLKEVREKQQDKENHAQQVRQKKMEESDNNPDPVECA